MNAKEIKKIRKRLGLTQGQFAELVGATPRSVAGWELGESKPLPIFERQIKALAKKTGKAA